MKSFHGENRGERLGEFESRSVKTQEAVKGFHLPENSHKLCRCCCMTQPPKKINNLPGSKVWTAKPLKFRETKTRMATLNFFDSPVNYGVVK